MPYKNKEDRLNYGRKYMKNKRGGVVVPIVVPDANLKVVPDANLKVVPDANLKVVPDANLKVVPDANLKVVPDANLKYLSTQIYRFVCKDAKINNTYIGATTNWRIRKANHKQACTKPKHMKYHLNVYQIIRDNGGWNNWNMQLIEYYPCNTSKESNKREQYWKECYNDNMGSKKAYYNTTLDPEIVVPESPHHYIQWTRRVFKLHREFYKSAWFARWQYTLLVVHKELREAHI